MAFKPAKTIPEFLSNFIVESNAIEGIYREPTEEEIFASKNFLNLKKISLNDLKRYIAACQPDAVLRDQVGLNVYIGEYVPPKGGIEIKTRLEDFLKDISSDWDLVDNDTPLGCRTSPFKAHNFYETLHPFTDCNGRSGRIIWLWQMLRLKKNLAPLGFLQSFYYQTLSAK